MSHLGRWLTALVDGELDAAERDHVLNHLAGCPPCLREANEMRALKRRLTALGEPGDDAAIAGWLIDLVKFEHGPHGPSARLGARRSGDHTGALALGRRLLPAGLVRHGWTMAAGSAAAGLAAIGVAAFALSNSAGPPPAPRITPAVDSYVLQHAYDAGQSKVRSTSGSSLLQLGQGSKDQGVAGYGQLGRGSYGLWHTSSGTLMSPEPFGPATTSPARSTSLPSAGSTSAPLRHGGHQPARKKAP